MRSRPRPRCGSFRLMPASVFVLALALVLAAPAVVSAQTGASGMAFLKFGAGGRSIAMGDASVAGATLGEALYYNPARAAADGRSALTAMYQDYIQDITTSYLGGVAQFDGWTLGVHMGLTTVRDIEVRDMPGEPQGRFDSQNLSTGLTLATALADDLHAGVTVKYLYEKIYVDDAGGYGVDLGLAYRTGAADAWLPVSVGVALANLGSMSALRTEATELPTILRYGATWTLPMAALRGGLTVEANGVGMLREKTHHLHVGAEVDYEQSIFLRAGYMTGYDVKGFTAGFGAAYAMLVIDYAVTPFSENFGTAHTVSVSLQL